ncbi:MAG: LysR family transcriptional regulator [Lawsonibacter sp.]
MLRDREYIYAVYQERSFSRAAQKLFISQPALSSKVKKVEERVGTALFDRSTSPIQLTPAGKCYIEATEHVMAVEEELRTRISQLSDRREGTITVGGATYFCSYVLPELALDFQRRFPGYTVSLLEGNTGDLTQCLQSGVVDFVLDVDALDPGLFTGRVWGQEELILAVPADLAVNERLRDKRLTFEQVRSGSGLGPDSPRVSLEEFRDEEFLLLKKGNDIYRRALAMCRNAGFKPKVSMYLDQMLTSYHVAANGHGIAFIRAGVLDHVKPTDRQYFYQIDDDNVVRTIYLYCRKDTPMPPIAADFQAFMEEKRQ